MPTDVVIKVLEAARHREGEDYEAAFKAQKDAVKLLMTEFKNYRVEKGEFSATQWMLPIMETMHRDLRKLAFLTYDAEEERAEGGDGDEGSEKWLKEALIEMNQALQECTRGDMYPYGAGALMFLNEMYNISIKASNFFGFVDSGERKLRHSFGEDQPFDTHLHKTFKMAHIIEYYFNSGRRSLLQAKYKEASKTLSEAFKWCYMDSVSNKRQILLYLIPVKMRVGSRPSVALLRKYGMEQFIGIADAIGNGNVQLLESELLRGQADFVRWGLFMVLKKLRIIAFRNLFRKVYLIIHKAEGTEAKSTVVEIKAFKVALDFQGQETSIDEVECMVANLISQGYIKGYISHKLGKVVFSKKGPFPPLATVGN